MDWIPFPKYRIFFEKCLLFKRSLQIFFPLYRTIHLNSYTRAKIFRIQVNRQTPAFDWIQKKYIKICWAFNGTKHELIFICKSMASILNIASLSISYSWNHFMLIHIFIVVSHLQFVWINAWWRNIKYWKKLIQKLRNQNRNYDTEIILHKKCVEEFCFHFEFPPQKISILF